MNAPFKIETILANTAVGISELKKNPSAVVKAARDGQVAILNRNKPVAYVISPEVWEYLCDLETDRRVETEARDALEEGDEGNVEIDLEDYL